MPDKFFFTAHFVLVTFLFFVDYYTFCEMLIMQPLQLRMGFQLKLKLEDDEVVKMRDEIRRNFFKIQNILRQVSLCLLLVFRYFC
jgi:hypothetical protein